MTESAFWNKLKKKLKAEGWLCEKIPQGRFKSGFPDSVLVDDYGNVVFAELKIQHNKLSPLQAKKMEILQNKGARVVVLRLCDGELTITLWNGYEAEDFNIIEGIKKAWEKK